MGMTAKDGSQEVSGEYRRGPSRKPPRPHTRRRRCLSEDVMRRSSGRLTTFQKLDREMGRFVESQQNGKAANQQEHKSGSIQVSEEESCSVRGVRRGVKWKCGWMFEQDSLYWETVRRQNLSPGNLCRRSAQARDSTATTCDSSSSSALECENLGEDALRRHCSSDYEAISSGAELNLRGSQVSSRRRGLKQEVLETNGGEEEKRRADLEWPAILKAKCKVLQLEKELADQRLRQQNADLAQAAEMAHCLRSSVQTILETAKRGTVSAPCTPGRSHQEDCTPGLQQRIQRLHTGNVQRDLEDQAKSFQSRIETLRLQSQIRSGDSSISKTRLSSTSSTTQVLTSDGEDWAQVQEVLKQLRGKTGSLQFSCENWEKRAIFAESKAASLQIEEEKWRVAAQKAEERVRELERDLVQVRATLEEVRNRHALEQSRLLGSGSSHGYTLVLQPIVTSNSSCKGATDCDSCSHCHISTSSGFHHPAAVSDVDNTPEDAASFENCIDIFDEPSSDRPPSSNQVHTPDREPSEATATSEQASSRHRYEGAQEDDDSQTPPKAEPVSTVQETSKTETEKSISQKWFKQRPKNRRPGTPSSDMSMSETRSNLGNSPIPSKGLQRKGNANGAQKPGPVYAGSLRVSSPSHLEKRVPLREIKRNASCSPREVTTKSEFS